MISCTTVVCQVCDIEPLWYWASLCASACEGSSVILWPSFNIWLPCVWVCACVCVCLCVSLCVSVCLCVSLRVSACLCVSLSLSICFSISVLFLYVYIYIYMSVCLAFLSHVWMCSCGSPYVCVRTHLCTSETNLQRKAWQSNLFSCRLFRWLHRWQGVRAYLLAFLSLRPLAHGDANWATEGSSGLELGVALSLST